MSSEHPSLSILPADEANHLRVIAIGPLDVVNNYVITQHHLGFAEVAEWSRPLPTANAGKIMRILTKRFGRESS